MQLSCQEKGPVFGPPNKLSENRTLKKAGEYLAAPEDADLLIVHKATTSPTALDGKDTDSIVLLCYHAVWIPRISSFILG